MKYQKKEVNSAVYMAMFGIQTTIMTSQKNLDSLRKDMEGLPKGFNFGGLGKEAFCNGLKQYLQSEDRYFNENPLEAIKGNPRWDNFCDDCIDLAMLSSVIYGHPVPLMHPDSYMKGIANSINRFKPALIPTLIKDVPIVRMDH